jgi:hypothetical protein
MSQVIQQIRIVFTVVLTAVAVATVASLAAVERTPAAHLGASMPHQQQLITLTPEADTDVTDAFPQANRCTEPQLQVGALFFEQDTYRYRGLLDFDISGLPQDVQIESAELRLRLSGSSGSGGSPRSGRPVRWFSAPRLRPRPWGCAATASGTPSSTTTGRKT